MRQLRPGRFGPSPKSQAIAASPSMTPTGRSGRTSAATPSSGGTWRPSSRSPGPSRCAPGGQGAARRTGRERRPRWPRGSCRPPGTGWPVRRPGSSGRRAGRPHPGEPSSRVCANRGYLVGQQPLEALAAQAWSVRRASCRGWSRRAATGRAEGTTSLSKASPDACDQVPDRGPRRFGRLVQVEQAALHRVERSRATAAWSPTPSGTAGRPGRPIPSGPRPSATPAAALPGQEAGPDREWIWHRPRVNVERPPTGGRFHLLTRPRRASGWRRSTRCSPSRRGSRLLPVDEVTTEAARARRFRAGPGTTPYLNTIPPGKEASARGSWPSTTASGR